MPAPAPLRVGRSWYPRRRCGVAPLVGAADVNVRVVYQVIIQMSRPSRCRVGVWRVCAAGGLSHVVGDVRNTDVVHVHHGVIDVTGERAPDAKVGCGADVRVDLDAHHNGT